MWIVPAGPLLPLLPPQLLRPTLSARTSYTRLRVFVSNEVHCSATLRVCNSSYGLLVSSPPPSFPTSYVTHSINCVGVRCVSHSFDCNQYDEPALREEERITKLFTCRCTAELPFEETDEWCLVSIQHYISIAVLSFVER